MARSLVDYVNEAKHFKSLHVPGQPLLLANVHDVASARAVAALPGCKALATASYSVALANDTDDAHLDLDTYLGVVRDIAAVARSAGKPLTVDLQDGYGDRLEEAVKGIIALGVVGINLEDSDQKTSAMMDEAQAVQRIKLALAAAAEVGVPDFVVNARSDTFLRNGTLDESIRRGNLYLEAGATVVYIIGGGPGGLTRQDVEKMVTGLQGRVNVGVRLFKPPGAVTVLNSKDVAELGVARVSVGPQLYVAAMEAIKKAATAVFGDT
jgi:2-methylisocitrate lyase-like PEP mutase family enzyme